MEYDALLEMADTLIVSIKKHCKTSTLPEKPDELKDTENRLSIRKILYS